jgi:hypothetical protein
MPGANRFDHANPGAHYNSHFDPEMARSRADNAIVLDGFINLSRLGSSAPRALWKPSAPPLIYPL